MSKTVPLINVSQNISLSDRDHALQRPQIVINSVETESHSKVLYRKDGLLELITGYFNLGLIHLLLEIISNSVDNSNKNGHLGKLNAILAKCQQGSEAYIRNCEKSDVTVTVEITPEYMSVKNYGAPFDIDFAEDSDLFIPERCFQETKFGSNFNDDQVERIGTGRNGYGAKLPNFYSKFFQVTCVDYERKRFFSMKLTNNGDPKTKEIRVWPEPKNGKMSNGRGDPTDPEILEHFQEKRSWTHVHWVPDYEEVLTAEGLEEYAKTLINGDLVILRRTKADRSCEEIKVNVKTGKDLTGTTVGGSNTINITGSIGQLSHIRSVKNGSSYPPTACIFRGTRGISDEEIDLAARYCLDFTTSGVPILLRREWNDGSTNEELLLPRTIADYGKMLFGEETKFLTHNWQHRDGSIRCNIAYFDTPGNGLQIGFVNGVWADTGIHMKAANSALWDKLHLNDDIKKYAPGATVADFKKHVSVLVLCFGTNPIQGGQVKTGLNNISNKGSFTIGDINEDMANKMFTGKNAWGSMKALMEAGLDKDTEQLRAKMRGLKTIGHVPANEKGPDSTLAYCEGESAAAYASIMRNLQADSDRIGIFPGRGVPKNLYGADIREAIVNAYFASFMKVCNLDDKKTYETEEDLNTLNYGKFIFFGDADLDGYHIIGLMIANLWTYWPELFRQRRVGMWRTPVVRIFANGSKGPEAKILGRYYSDKEYDDAVISGSAPKGRVKRLKGLGSVNIGDLAKPGNEIMDDHEFGRVIWFDMTEDGEFAIETFFSTGMGCAKERKVAITELASTCNDEENEYDDSDECNLDQLGPAPIQRCDVYEFTTRKIVQYCIGSLVRQIPYMRDGLKDVQRKLLAYFLEHTRFGETYILQKVETLVGKVAEKQDYHHGAEIMGNCLKRMTVQGFSGANNLSPFVADGNHGSKLNWPKDAAANRYPFVAPSAWLKYAFFRDVYNCIQRVKSNGEEIEPLWLPCTIPFAIMNGFSGIASGWSTYLPPFHVTTVLNYLHERVLSIIDGRPQKPVEVIPWYSKFRGTMEMTKGIAKVAVDEEIENEKGEIEIIEAEEQEVAKAIKMSGIWEVRKPTGKVHSSVVAVLYITEVPPEVRLKRLIGTLENLVASEHVKKFRTDTKKGIDIVVELTATGKELYDSGKLIKILKLVETYSMTNFHMLDDNGAPRKFVDIYEYLNFFLESILEVYEISRKNRIREMEADIRNIEIKLKYIDLCIAGKIKIGEMKRVEILAILKQNGIQHEDIKTVDSMDINEDGRAEYVALIDKKRAIIDEMKNTPAAVLYNKHLEALIPKIEACPMPEKISDVKWKSNE